MLWVLNGIWKKCLSLCLEHSKLSINGNFYYRSYYYLDNAKNSIISETCWTLYAGKYALNPNNTTFYFLPSFPHRQPPRKIVKELILEEKKMFVLLNKCERLHFSCSLFFQVVFISTPPRQDVPGDQIRKFHMEITLPISHAEISDCRGTKGLGHPPYPVFLGVPALGATLLSSTHLSLSLCWMLATTRDSVGHSSQKSQ